MNVEQIVELLNNTYNICDKLDDAGFGAYRLTKGDYRTKETLKIELSRFLIWVGNVDGSFPDIGISLITIVSGKKLSASQIKELDETCDPPKPDTSLAFLGFVASDSALNAAKGTKDWKMTNILINTYDLMGQMMVLLNKNNPDVKARVDGFINDMKTYASEHI